MADETRSVEEQAVNETETTTKEQPESLPSLASIFKPEEFFEMDPIEETSLSRICCGYE